ncbi:MAG: GC-type dockerin domain-anchored protein [Phycisphaerales bacterium]|nr:GC-type dockerin domain-anchored protein [Phycisphaerales bacterium]
MKAKSALSLALAAGIASTAAASNTPTTLSPSNGTVKEAAHIYFNIATGEKVVTLIGDSQTAPAGTVSAPIWSSINQNVCVDTGIHTTEYFFGVDDNSDTSMGGPHTSLATAVTNIDYGDIALDTLVDMVHIDWVVAHPDTDTDSDGLGDGVVGLAGQWTYFDADNGRQLNVSTRIPLVSFTFLDLPGNVFAADELTGYTADIDLAATFSSSLTFELGDSDGDLQGAAAGSNDVDTDSDGIGDGVSVANADRDFDSLPDSDLDGDGLFDWSWGVRFYQPGTDSDGDGIADGDPADSMQTIGIGFAAPDGTAVDNGDGTWMWDIDTSTPDAGTGIEDRFALYAAPDTNGDIIYAGGFWFGGMECDSAPLPDGPGYTPHASFEHQLFGPSDAACLPDYNGDGSLNFFDISTFLGLFSAMDPSADYNGDGSFNFFDISAFLGDFAAGCP